MRLRHFYQFGLLLLLTVFSVYSCTKDKVHTSTLPGLYIGVYTVDNLPKQGALFYSFVVYPDGSLITKGKGGDGTDLYSEGTWTLTGTTFKGTINTFVKYEGKPITQTITATYMNNGKLKNGVWKDIVNPYTTNSGTFPIMERVD